MAYTVQAAFDAYHQAINLEGDYRTTANNRKEHLLALLGNKFEVLDSFGSGSLERFTALKETADVDAFLVLHYGKHVKGKTPAEVLQSVRDALGTSKNNVRKNGQAVTLYYTTWPNADIVPVSRVTDTNGNVTHYNVPDMNSGNWIPSDPKKHSADVAAKASACGPNFRKLVKMMKHWNLRHGNFLQSYHVEVMAIRAFEGDLSDLPWHAFQFFDNCLGLTDGILWHGLANADDYLSWTDRNEVRKRLAWAADKARSAWYAGTQNDAKTAITTWKQIYGDEFPAYG